MWFRHYTWILVNEGVVICAFVILGSAKHRLIGINIGIYHLRFELDYCSIQSFIGALLLFTEWLDIQIVQVWLKQNF